MQANSIRLARLVGQLEDVEIIVREYHRHEDRYPLVVKDHLLDALRSIEQACRSLGYATDLREESEDAE